MSDRPIFVVGFQRSGTTLLQSLLGRHPRIAAPPELHFFFRIYDLRDYWGDLHDDARVRPVVRELLDVPFGLFADCGFDEDVLVNRFLASDRSYRSLLEAVLGDFARRLGKVRWSEKTPNQRPDQIWSLLPDAQVVHIRRDPREVVASAATAWAHPAPPVVLAKRWREFVLRTRDAGAQAAASSFLEIRYEDLAADPAATVAHICEFLEEDYSPAMLESSGTSTAVSRSGVRWQREAAEPVRAPASQWANRLSWHDRAMISSVVTDVLEPLGYPPAPSGLVRAGRVLAPLAVRRFRAAQWLRTRDARRVTTPAERYALVKRFIAERERAARDDG